LYLFFEEKAMTPEERAEKLKTFFNKARKNVMDTAKETGKVLGEYKQAMDDAVIRGAEAIDKVLGN
jgi:hypothetical protein